MTTPYLGLSHLAGSGAAFVTIPASTLAALVAAAALCESIASVPCDHRELGSARLYWCSTWQSYHPCPGDEARDVMQLLQGRRA